MRRMIAAVLALMLALSLCACGKQAAGDGTESPGAGQETLTWQEQYDLGVRYLSEGDYEQAIIAFTAAIEIDPKRAEAYLGLSDAYAEQGDIANAIEALERGQEQTEDPAIQERLEQLLALQNSGELNSYVVYSYDEQGREIRQASYDANGQLQWAYDLEYDEISGKVNKRIRYSAENKIEGWTVYYLYFHPGGGEWHTYPEIDYDADGQILLRDDEDCVVSGGELTQYSETDSRGTSVYELANGKVVRDTRTETGGYYNEEIRENIFNEIGKMTSQRIYYDGVLYYEHTFEYDDANNTVQIASWGKNIINTPNPTRRFLAYDEQGRILEESSITGGSSTIYSYDADGCVTENRYDNGELLSTSADTRSGIIIEKTFVDSDGEIFSSEYDILDNPIENAHYTCTRTNDGLPQEVYEDGALKRSYSYQAETFTIMDHQNDTTRTYSMDGVLLAENDGYNNTLHLYNSEGKLVRTLSFAKAAA